MNVNEKIEARRNELGLSDVEVAKQLGLEIAWYGDVEQYADEIFTTVELRKVKQLCEILKYEFFDLFELKCTFCQENEPYLLEYSLSRDELIYKRRTQKGLSVEELGDQVNLYAWAVRKIETDQFELETYILEQIKEISKVLEVPLQILFGVKCGKCNR